MIVNGTFLLLCTALLVSLRKAWSPKFISSIYCMQHALPNLTLLHKELKV